MRTLLICMLCAATAYAQYDSPVPQRLQIPGAVPLNVPRGSFRQGRLQAVPVAGPRIRRPGLARPSFKSVDASPRPSLQSLEEPAKPVTEEPEDEVEINTPTPYSPNIFSTAEPISDFFDITTTTQPKPAIFNTSPFTPSEQPNYRPEPIRPTPYRPLPPSAFAPIRNEPIKPQPQPVRLQPLSSRPQRPVFRPEPKPFVEEEEVPIQPVRQYSRPQQQEPVRRDPIKSVPQQKYTPSHNREKKPVAQIIRKYTDEKPDGSITWGFENDDGSFKEETIGIDCVTRGKYGYIDPDGVKREYNYETGIPCDKTKTDQEEKGFIDYQENKAVLPNGITIDLAAMGKKSKRPFRSPTNH